MLGFLAVILLLVFMLGDVTVSTAHRSPKNVPKHLNAPPAFQACETEVHPQKTTQMLDYCEKLGDLFDAVRTDLSPWSSEAGITAQAMQMAIKAYSTAGHNKGIVMGFKNGKSYVVEATMRPYLRHHASIAFTYMLVIAELADIFGNRIPDVEFVLATSDQPMVVLPYDKTQKSEHHSNYTQTYPPVFRFCSSPRHADIQIPIFHFYTKKYQKNFLNEVPNINNRYPWGSKEPLVFGRFSNYDRHIHPAIVLLQRQGTNGSEICSKDGDSLMSCHVRQHLFAWAKRHPDLLNIKSGPMILMTEHARFKYLVHVDGQALSSRLEQLMPLNSLIFKEESGYTTFFHHLLKPHIHYLPFWKREPDDLLEGLEWANAHDEEARAIAANAQMFALRYLNKAARTCYWYKLFVEYAKLLRYTPGPNSTATEGYTWTPTHEYLSQVAETFEGGKWFHPKIEAF